MKRPTMLYVYVAAVFVLAGALCIRFVVGGAFAVPREAASFWNAIAALTALGILAEALSLDLRIGTARSSAVFVPHLAAILLVGPAWSMAIAAFVALVAETFLRRKPLIKVIYNTSASSLSVALAGMFYLTASGSFSVSSFSINPAGYLGAVVAYWVVLNGGAATAVSLSTGAELGETWNQFVAKGLIKDVLSSTISVLLAFLFIALGLWGLVLVLAPIFFVRQELHQNLQLEQTNRELLVLMVKSIEARDPYTSGHSVRVARYAKALARALALPSKEVEQIETAALLHDVGKIYEEFAFILRKPGGLSTEERDLMRSHPVKSAELVSTISSLRGYVEGCVRAHHESFDGSGYPDGLAGNEIPVGARIIMVADTADAMMTSRPYREALDYEQVQAELDKYAGTQFDPEVVAAFRMSAAMRQLIEQRDVAELLPAEGISRSRSHRWSSQHAAENRRTSFPTSPAVATKRSNVGPA